MDEKRKDLEEAEKALNESKTDALRKVHQDNVSNIKKDIEILEGEKKKNWLRW